MELRELTTNTKLQLTPWQLTSALEDMTRSPFEHLDTKETILENGAVQKESTFATWLLYDDTKREPTTPKGMMKRLNILKEFGFLLKHDSVKLVVDDRALIVNIIFYPDTRFKKPYDNTEDLKVINETKRRYNYLSKKLSILDPTLEGQKVKEIQTEIADILDFFHNEVYHGTTLIKKYTKYYNENKIK